MASFQLLQIQFLFTIKQCSLSNHNRHGHVSQEVINDDDAKLKFLQKEFGYDVCDAMKTALMEMNEYNPSERQPILEFWNFGKGRKATVEEILMFVFSHLDKRHHQA
jgi:hypothetical protein